MLKLGADMELTEELLDNLYGNHIDIGDQLGISS